MSGNKFFRRSNNLSSENGEYNCTAHLLWKKPIVDASGLSLDKVWESALQDLNDNKEVEVSSNEAICNSALVPSAASTVAKDQETRMQEIEVFVLSNAIIRKILGNLCIWQGSLYKILDLQVFTQEVRRILPKSSQKRIRYFGKFKEAYEYMQANSELRGFTDEQMHRAQHMIAFRNGIYDAKRREFIAHAPSYPILFNVNANYIPSGNISASCFEKIINRATNFDQEVLELMYQVLGYIYSQGNMAKKFFVMGIAPDSGKSIIGEFIAKTLGDDNVSCIALNDFGTRFKLGTINKRVLNYNMDLPAVEVDRNSVQLLKELTGDSRTECEEKFVQGKTVKHHCKFLFATNHPIRLKYDDEAFFRRMILIPFINSVTEKDKDYDLPEKLWRERDVIATKAAHAYSRLLENNFIFQKSKLADKLLYEWREADETDLLRCFFSEKCKLTDNNSFIPTDVVFNQYKEFCIMKGEDADLLDKAQFSKKFHILYNLKMAKRRVPGYASPVNGYLGLDVIDFD